MRYDGMNGAEGNEVFWHRRRISPPNITLAPMKSPLEPRNEKYCSAYLFKLQIYGFDMIGNWKEITGFESREGWKRHPGPVFRRDGLSA